MSIFQPVKLTWKGTDYEIPADKVMRLIAEIEDVITISELMSQKGAPLAKLAMGYGAALRYAGAKISDDAVYETLFTDSQATVGPCITGLLMMMIPPQDDTIDTGEIEGKQQAANNS